MTTVQHLTLFLTGTLVVLVGVLTKRRLVMVTVVGSSMIPTFADGDMVLVRRTARRIGAGAIVVFRQPASWNDDSLSPRHGLTLNGSPFMIKRVAATDGSRLPSQLSHVGSVVPRGHIAVLGDNPGQSCDSRSFGFVPANQILGLVLLRVARASSLSPQPVKSAVPSTRRTRESPNSDP